MSCNECGGHLLPHNGTWTSIEEGVTSNRYVYCTDCMLLYRVRRENIAVEKIATIDVE